MAKIGTKTRTAKVYDKEYEETARGGVPKATDVSLFDNLLRDISMSVLRDQIQRFRPDFVERTSDVMSRRYRDIILPQGTRFYRQGINAVVFAIEVPPSVRTLSFKNDSNGQPPYVAPHDGKWSLSLPYLYFIPVFTVEPSRNTLAAMCLGCRTEPLDAPEDMLYCMNLPNTYHIQVVPAPGRMPEAGIVPGFQQMLICQGYINTRHSTPFQAKADTFNKMTQQALLHYWSSRYTSELSVVYKYMMSKFPDQFGSLDIWQAKSQDDPLFVLKTKYPPAIKLNCLFDDIMAVYDREEANILGCVNSYVGQVHDDVWREILLDEGYQKIRVDLNEAVLAKFTTAMQKFSKSLSQNMSSISNDTMKRHILLAITIALREAVK